VVNNFLVWDFEVNEPQKAVCLCSRIAEFLQKSRLSYVGVEVEADAPNLGYIYETPLLSFIIMQVRRLNEAHSNNTTSGFE
jgi:hypothetical protein